MTIQKGSSFLTNQVAIIQALYCRVHILQSIHKVTDTIRQCLTGKVDNNNTHTHAHAHTHYT